MAILTVNPGGGADYTTIAAAISAAAAVDIIEIQASIVEIVVLNKNIAAIRGTSKSIVWESASNGQILEIIGGLTQQLDIYNITMLKSSSGGQNIVWTTYGSGGKLHLYDVIMQMTVPSGGGRAIVQIQPDITAGADSLFFDRCEIIGNAKSQWGIRSFGLSVANTIKVQDCIFRDILGGNAAFDLPDGGASVQISRVYNNTFENCDLALNLLGRGDVSNNLCMNNTDDVSVSSNGDFGDASFNAFSQATVGEGSWGSSNIFGITPNDECVDISAHDYHLKMGAQARNNGTNTGATPDLDGNPRPQGSGWDIGAYEYLESNARAFIVGTI